MGVLMDRKKKIFHGISSNKLYKSPTSITLLNTLLNKNNKFGTNNKKHKSRRQKYIKSVIREVVGLSSYERRIIELLKVGKEKHALRFAKNKVNLYLALIHFNDKFILSKKRYLKIRNFSMKKNTLVLK